MKDVEQQLRLLNDFRIACVIIGGVAATLHGSSIPTRDLDVCYDRSSENISRIVSALRKVNARLRGAPSGLPFILDEETLRRGMNFTFATDVGDLDLLGEVAGVGGYSEALSQSLKVELFGLPFEVLALQKLIIAKQTAGRPKDLATLAELEAIHEAQQASEDPKAADPE